MTLQYRAAVLHAAQTPMSIETITATGLKPTDALVRIRAAGLCHTDLEVIEGSLRYPGRSSSGTRPPGSSSRSAPPRSG